MSYEEKIETITVEASADLSTKQYYVVNLTSSKQIELANVLGEQVLGVLQDKPAAAGRAANVAIGGISKVVAGAAITAGAQVVAMATGKIQATSAADQYILGTAMEAASGDGAIIAVKIDNYQRSL